MIHFDEEKHEYTYNGKKLISVTQILKKYGLSVDYTNIPKHVLEKAAVKGKAIHEALEAYVKGNRNLIGVFREVALVDQYMKARNVDLSTAIPEKIYFDTNYLIAGTVDIQYIDNNSYVIADYKTTSTLHIDVVAWQLSIYNFLITGGDIIKYYFNSLKVFHLYDNRLSVKDVYTVDYDAIKNLLIAHQNGEDTYTYIKPNKIITTSEEDYLVQLLIEQQSYKEQLKKIEQEYEVLTEKLKKNFIKEKEYKYHSDRIKIAYTPPQTTSRINITKVKELIKNTCEKTGEDPNDYFTEITKKDSVRITPVKENKKEHDV